MRMDHWTTMARCAYGLSLKSWYRDRDQFQLSPYRCRGRPSEAPHGTPLGTYGTNAAPGLVCLLRGYLHSHSDYSACRLPHYEWPTVVSRGSMSRTGVNS